MFKIRQNRIAIRYIPQVFKSRCRKPDYNLYLSDLMLFGKKQPHNALCAFGFHADGVSFVHVSLNSDNISHIEAIDFIPGDAKVHPLLVKTIAKQHKFKNTPCATCLGPKDYRLFVTEAPEVPDEDLIAALAWEVKELIDFPIEEATLDTFEVPDETNFKKHINVVAVPKNIIGSYNDIFKAEKLNLQIIDIQELALRNLAMLNGQDIDGTVLLWLEKNYGKILFIKDKNLYMAKNIDFGSDFLQSNIGGMDTIALEVQRSIDYFERHFSQISIKNLMLMPFDGDNETFIDFLNKNLSLKCVNFDPGDAVTGLENIDPVMLAKLQITLGTALRQKREID